MVELKTNARFRVFTDGSSLLGCNALLTDKYLSTFGRIVESGFTFTAKLFWKRNSLFKSRCFSCLICCCHHVLCSNLMTLMMMIMKSL